MPAIAGIIADRWVNAEGYTDFQYAWWRNAIILSRLVNSPTAMFMGYACKHDVLHAYHSLSITVAYRR
jgi:hypothetical protein